MSPGSSVIHDQYSRLAEMSKTIRDDFSSWRNSPLT
jgi:hypothetical protein